MKLNDLIQDLQLLREQGFGDSHIDVLVPTRNKLIAIDSIEGHRTPQGFSRIVLKGIIKKSKPKEILNQFKKPRHLVLLNSQE